MVVDAPRRGYGAACHAGLLVATSDVVAVMDADASLDPAQLPAIAGPVVAGDADLVLGRRTTRFSYLAAPGPGGERCSRAYHPAAHRARASRPRTRPCLPARAAVRSRTERPSVGLPAADTARCARGRLADRGGARAVTCRGSAGPRSPAPCPATSGRFATCARCWRNDSDPRESGRAARRPGQEPGAGAGQDPAHAAFHSDGGGSAGGGGPRRHPACGGGAPTCAGCCWCSTVNPATGSRPGSRCARSARGLLDERIAHALVSALARPRAAGAPGRDGHPTGHRRRPRPRGRPAARGRHRRRARPCHRRWLLGPRAAPPARRARAVGADVAGRHRPAAAAIGSSRAACGSGCWRPAGTSTSPPTWTWSPPRHPEVRSRPSWSGSRQVPRDGRRCTPARCATDGGWRPCTPTAPGWPCPSSPGAVRCSPGTPPCSTAAPERPSTSAVARAGSPLPSAGRVCPRSVSTSTMTPYASPGPRAPACSAARSSATCHGPAGGTPCCSPTGTSASAACPSSCSAGWPPCCHRPAVPWSRSRGRTRKAAAPGCGWPAVIASRGPSPWAHLALCDADGAATLAGLRTEESWQASGRWFVALRNVRRPGETEGR